MSITTPQRERLLDTLSRGFFVGLPIAAVTGLAYALYMTAAVLLEVAGFANIWVGIVVIVLGTTLWLYGIGRVAAPRDYAIPRRTGFHSIRDLQKVFNH